jgi:hypothetical protein
MAASVSCCLSSRTCFCSFRKALVSSSISGAMISSLVQIVSNSGVCSAWRRQTLESSLTKKCPFHGCVLWCQRTTPAKISCTLQSWHQSRPELVLNVIESAVHWQNHESTDQALVSSVTIIITLPSVANTSSRSAVSRSMVMSFSLTSSAVYT